MQGPLKFQSSRTAMILPALMGAGFVWFGFETAGDPGVTRIRNLLNLEVPNSAMGVFAVFLGTVFVVAAVLMIVRPNRVTVDAVGIHLDGPFRKTDYAWRDVAGFSEQQGFLRLQLTPAAEQRLGRNGKYATIPKPPKKLQPVLFARLQAAQKVAQRSAGSFFQG